MFTKKSKTSQKNIRKRTNSELELESDSDPKIDQSEANKNKQENVVAADVLELLRFKHRRTKGIDAHELSSTLLNNNNNTSTETPTAEATSNTADPWKLSDKLSGNKLEKPAENVDVARKSIFHSGGRRKWTESTPFSANHNYADVIEVLIICGAERNAPQGRHARWNALISASGTDQLKRLKNWFNSVSTKN